MYDFSVSDLNQIIENTLNENKKISKMLMGYKLFHELMNDPK